MEGFGKVLQEPIFYEPIEASSFYEIDAGEFHNLSNSAAIVGSVAMGLTVFTFGFGIIGAFLEAG